MAKIKVQDTEVSVVSFKEQDYICLTDMANAKESESRAADIIKNWLRNRLYHRVPWYVGNDTQP